MTFLDFTLVDVLGEPVKQSGSRNLWYCPFVEHSTPKLTTLPPNDNYPNKFKCYACGTWGDEFDIIQPKYPNDTYPERVERLKTMKKKFLKTNRKPDYWFRGILTVPSSDNVVMLHNMLNEGDIDDDDIEDVMSDIKMGRERHKLWLRETKAGQKVVQDFLEDEREDLDAQMIINVLLQIADN